MTEPKLRSHWHIEIPQHRPKDSAITCKRSYSNQSEPSFAWPCRHICACAVERELKIQPKFTRPFSSFWGWGLGTRLHSQIFGVDKVKSWNRHREGQGCYPPFSFVPPFLWQIKYTITPLFSQESLSDTDTHTYLEKYLDDSCDYGELGELNFTEDLYSFIEQFLYITKQTAVHTEIIIVIKCNDEACIALSDSL